MTTPDELYRAIKSNEVAFPLPIPSATIDVGTFRPGLLAGNDEPLEPRDPTDPFPKPHPVGPKPLNLPAAFVTGAVNVTLRFKSTAPGITVTVAGRSAHSEGTSVSIDVGDAVRVPFTLESGGQQYHDTLTIKRPPIIGVGAFTVPALPVTIAYEPPFDPAQKNKLSYSESTTTSMTTTMSFASSEASSRAIGGTFQDLQAAVSLLAKIGPELLRDKQLLATTFAEAGGDGAATPTGLNIWAGLEAALGLVAKLMGTTQSKSTASTELTQNKSLTIKTHNSLTLTKAPLDASSGPGVTDDIAYLQNVRIAWIAVNGGSSVARGVYLTVIDHEGLTTSSVAALRAGTSGLPADVASALLALDPFVAGGPGAALAKDRFEPYLHIGPTPGLGVDASRSLTRESSSQQASVRTTGRVVEERKGWLAFLGVGNTEDRDTTTKYTTTHSSDAGTSRTTTASLSLFFSPSEHPFAIDVYFDRAFGTFAVRPVVMPASSSPTPTEIIARSYQEAFGRAPGAAETTAWLDSFHGATRTVQELVAAHLVWLKRPEAEGELRAVITRSYQAALGRAPGSDESTAWFTSLRAAPRSYVDLVAAHVVWLVSPAGAGERSQVVQRAYQDALGRAPSAAELAAALSKIVAQKLSCAQLTAELRR